MNSDKFITEKAKDVTYVVLRAVPTCKAEKRKHTSALRNVFKLRHNIKF